jgi:intracellular multiplication protein IcmD
MVKFSILIHNLIKSLSGKVTKEIGMQIGKKIAGLTALGLIASTAFATGTDIAAVATTITSEVNAVAKLLSVTAYVAGVGFALGGILQFKAHKENPQQTPLSKPVVMIIVSACLLFLPTILNIAGATLFGSSATSSASAGGGASLSGQ